MKSFSFVWFAAIVVALSLLVSVPVDPASACSEGSNPFTWYWFEGTAPSLFPTVEIIDGSATLQHIPRDRDRVGGGCAARRCGGIDYASRVELQLEIDAGGVESTYGYHVEFEGAWSGHYSLPLAVAPGTTRLELTQSFRAGELPNGALRVRVSPTNGHWELGTASAWFEITPTEL